MFLELAAAKKRNNNWHGIRNVPMPGCIVHDLTKLPIPNIKENTYDGVYSEHFIEHLEKDQGVNLFKECLRILKPGGTIRIVWPAMEAIAWLKSSEDLSGNDFVKRYYTFYVKEHNFCPQKYRNLRIQEQVYEGIIWQNGEHKYIWGCEELLGELKKIGFSDVKECIYRKSDVVEFKDLEKIDGMRECHSKVVEAKKPWA